MNDAKRCRKNGWKVGDRLIGYECGTASIIRLTAIGVENVLAIEETSESPYEGLWSLDCRRWRRLSDVTASARE